MSLATPSQAHALFSNAAVKKKRNERTSFQVSLLLRALSPNHDVHTRVCQDSNCSNFNQKVKTTKTISQAEDLSIEESKGEGLMLFDDPMFPPDEDD
jgi:hypothetical protein